MAIFVQGRECCDIARSPTNPERPKPPHYKRDSTMALALACVLVLVVALNSHERSRGKLGTGMSMGMAAFSEAHPSRPASTFDVHACAQWLQVESQNQLANTRRGGTALALEIDSCLRGKCSASFTCCLSVTTRGWMWSTCLQKPPAQTRAEFVISGVRVVSGVCDESVAGAICQ